ncbi:MAG: PCRF domain-containing protein, partial [Pseudohongiellaceae bacterium]
MDGSRRGHRAGLQETRLRHAAGESSVAAGRHLHRQCCGHPLECRPRDGVISCWKSTPLCNASRTVLSASWCSGGIFDFDHKQDRLTEVEAELAESNVWDKPEHAQALGRERAELERVVGTILALQRQFADCNELITLAGEDQDESLFTAA